MTLTEFFDQAKAELIRANKDNRHPFRTMVLATHAPFPGVRTIVKRQTDNKLSVLAYTDTRTPKVKELIEDANCSLLFYHPKKKLQVRLACQAEIIQEGSLFEKHKQSIVSHPKDYSTDLKPGAVLQGADYGMGETLHFCLLQFEPQLIEILSLGRERHYRALYKKENDWLGSWLVP